MRLSAKSSLHELQHLALRQQKGAKNVIILAPSTSAQCLFLVRRLFLAWRVALDHHLTVPAAGFPKLDAARRVEPKITCCDDLAEKMARAINLTVLVDSSCGGGVSMSPGSPGLAESDALSVAQFKRCCRAPWRPSSNVLLIYGQDICATDPEPTTSQRKT